MNTRNLLEQFEEFLATIPLERYRNELMPVKTVEQDLPKDLNPLPAIYANYWLPKPVKFPDYEEFFSAWWEGHLKPLDDFIRKYFWGCSYEFVHLGFKARIYRTFISVLTQFHFAYSWLAFCSLPLKASADLDMQGIDALVTTEDGTKVAIQIMKETYRPEARERGKFAQRKIQTNLFVEVPYTIAQPDEWRQRAERARKDETKKQAQLFGLLAEKFQRWLPNGFAVFQPDYPQMVEQLIKEAIKRGRQGTIGWHEILEWLESKGY